MYHMNPYMPAVASDTTAWLSTHSCRKKFTLSRASGQVTDYQVMLLVGESAGATGEDVNCGGLCLSTFNDLRFTNSDGTTLLDYWIESITGATPNKLATVWIEFDTINTTDTVFYMYYGDSDAVSASSGASTFIFFDDFERETDGTSIDVNDGSTLWPICVGGYEPAISTDRAYGGSRSAEFRGHATSPQAISDDFGASNNISIRLRAYKDGGSDFLFGHGNGTIRFIGRAETDEDISVFDGSTYNDIGNMTANEWHLYEVNNFDWDNALVDVWLDGVKIKASADFSYTNASVADALHLYCISTSTSTYTWVDDVIVRNYRVTGPTFGHWGPHQLK